MSGGFVPYNLRPNKSIDRQLFVDLLLRLNRFTSISSYNYISFGGTYFEDFKLVHSYFANLKMISIESNEVVYQRQKFNLPHACITTELCTSGDFITNKLDNTTKNILWLDYASPRELRQQIGELQAVLAKAQPLDIIKLTLNANPDALFSSKIKKDDSSPFTVPELNAKRLEVLQNRIGDFLPNNINAQKVDKKNYPSTLTESIGIASRAILETRESQLVFQPLTSFSYSDSEHQMMTFTGIVIEKTILPNFLEVTNLENWDLSNLTWGGCQNISVPSLTTLEKLTLDQKIPCNVDALTEVLNFQFDQNLDRHKETLNNYLKYYRYYPSFHKVLY